jgi:hypothetical protein
MYILVWSIKEEVKHSEMLQASDEKFMEGNPELSLQ